MAEFSGKVAIVSGGARGIGRAAARKLAGEGASVVICSDREEQVEETVAALREEGLEVRGVRSDVTSSADMKKLMDLAIETYGGVDVLVNSAGVQRYGTVVETEEEVWDEVLNANLKGVYLASRYAIPEMRKRGGGAIVNLSSVQAFASQTGVAAYTASKGGINALTRAMAGLPGLGGHADVAVVGGSVQGGRERRGDPGGLGLDAPAGKGGKTRRGRRGHRLPRQRQGELHHRWGLQGRRRHASRARRPPARLGEAGVCHRVDNL